MFRNSRATQYFEQLEGIPFLSPRNHHPAGLAGISTIVTGQSWRASFLPIADQRWVGRGRVPPRDYMKYPRLGNEQKETGRLQFQSYVVMINRAVRTRPPWSNTHVDHHANSQDRLWWWFSGPSVRTLGTSRVLAMKHPRRQATDC